MSYGSWYVRGEESPLSAEMATVAQNYFADQCGDEHGMGFFIEQPSVIWHDGT